MRRQVIVVLEIDDDPLESAHTRHHVLLEETVPAHQLLSRIDQEVEHILPRLLYPRIFALFAVNLPLYRLQLWRLSLVLVPSPLVRAGDKSRSANGR